MNAGPGVLAGRAEPLEDLEDRVDLAVAREQRAARGHLRHHAADAPQVHRQAVDLASQQDLGRTVPHRDHLVRVPLKGSKR